MSKQEQRHLRLSGLPERTRDAAGTAAGGQRLSAGGKSGLANMRFAFIHAVNNLPRGAPSWSRGGRCGGDNADDDDDDGVVAAAAEEEDWYKEQKKKRKAKRRKEWLYIQDFTLRIR